MFAWKPSDMPGVLTELAEHQLKVKLDAKPVKQPLRRFHDERRRAIGEEIARLLAAGFIMEVIHCNNPPWRTVPARSSFRTPSQNIWPCGLKSLLNDNHHNLRRTSATKEVSRDRLGGTASPAGQGTDQSSWKRKSWLRLRLGAAPLHRLWLGYWFLASLTDNLLA